MSKLSIKKDINGPELKSFIELPWQVYSDCPNWAPPLKMDVKRLLNERKHPFWQTGRRMLFLAVRNGQAVGRIAAIIDDWHNEFHGEKAGAWGFFECFNDAEAAAELFLAAENWVKDQGMDYIRGPLNPSTNYDLGLQIEGFEHQPVLMTPYNLPYYIELVRKCGYLPEQDLVSYRFNRGYQPPEWAAEIADRISVRDEVSIRLFSRRHIKRDLELFRVIYNGSLKDNWAYVPILREEIFEHIKEMFFIIDKELAFFLCYKGEPVGAAVILPDVNPIIKQLNGRFSLSGLIRLISGRRPFITGLKGLFFGVLPEYRQLGLPFLAFQQLEKVWKKRTKYNYIELGWGLADNDSVNRLYEEGGGRPYKRYRIYRKDFNN